MNSARAPHERLTDAVVELLLAEGFEGVTVRRVAAAAGVSIGAVQHHFPTKAAMLQAAMDRSSTQAEARVAAALAEAPTPERLLRTLATELLAAGPERRMSSVVWLQRAARAVVDPAMAAGHARDWRGVEDQLTLAVSACRPDKAAEWCADTAASLLALLDGLAVALLTEPDRMPAERAERLVAARLDEILAV